MKLSWPEPGRYVLAISGGVDSITLLDLMAKLKAANHWQLVVAHFDHGIRSDSAIDLKLVEQAAKSYGLGFRSSQQKLGKEASEELARNRRYQFLESVRVDVQADALITAHHQDDVIETALVNLIRGTKRLGLSSLKSSQTIMRPLLNVKKAELIKYAKSQGLNWREDRTNSDERYLRNYLRRQVMARITVAQQRQLVEMIIRASQLNVELDGLLEAEIGQHSQPGSLSRDWFQILPYDVASEVMASWLRRNRLRQFNHKVIERLVVGAKVGQAGKIYPIISHHFLKVDKDFLALEHLER